MKGGIYAWLFFFVFLFYVLLLCFASSFVSRALYPRCQILFVPGMEGARAIIALINITTTTTTITSSRIPRSSIRSPFLAAYKGNYCYESLIFNWIPSSTVFYPLSQSRLVCLHSPDQPLSIFNLLASCFSN